MKKKKSITFKYNRETKKGLLTVNGRKIRINESVEVHNTSVQSGSGGYGIHLI